MAGLDEITKEFRPKCPKCNQTLNLQEYVKELFSIIIDKLKAGNRVYVYGFGSFYVSKMKERYLKSIDGVERLVPPRNLVRFKSSDKLKKKLNSDDV